MIKDIKKEFLKPNIERCLCDTSKKTYMVVAKWWLSTQIFQIDIHMSIWNIWVHPYVIEPNLLQWHSFSHKIQNEYKSKVLLESL